MAKAEKKLVEEQVVTTKNVEVVVLTMTPDEARTLRDIFAMIGGSPYTTRRRLTDGMNRALSEIGVPKTEDGLYPADVSVQWRSIYFT